MENNKPTGLERWAKSHNSTAQEIQALVMAENPDGWRNILGFALDSETAVPSGRDTALAGMLERGRAGSIQVPFAAIAQATGCTPEIVAGAISSRKDNLYEGAVSQAADGQGGMGGVLLNSAYLLAVLLDITASQAGDASTYDQATKYLQALKGIQGNTDTGAEAEPDAKKEANETEKMPVPPANAEPIQADPMKPAAAATASAPTARPKAPKKTKYTIAKNAVSGILNPDNAQMPVREIRAFLLSLPGAKPMDIALMSDSEAVDSFNAEYNALYVGSGVVILGTAAYKQLSELLGSGSAYFIPSGNRAAAVITAWLNSNTALSPEEKAQMTSLLARGGLGDSPKTGGQV